MFLQPKCVSNSHNVKKFKNDDFTRNQSLCDKKNIVVEQLHDSKDAKKILKDKKGLSDHIRRCHKQIPLDSRTCSTCEHSHNNTADLKKYLKRTHESAKYFQPSIKCDLEF